MAAETTKYLSHSFRWLHKAAVYNNV